MLLVYLSALKPPRTLIFAGQNIRLLQQGLGYHMYEELMHNAARVGTLAHGARQSIVISTIGLTLQGISLTLFAHSGASDGRSDWQCVRAHGRLLRQRDPAARSEG